MDLKNNEVTIWLVGGHILNESLTLYTALGLIMILCGIYQAEQKRISANMPE